MESLYRGHRFPPEIISHAVWLYHRFTLSLRDVEDLLAERGILVSYEAIRYWCRKFGPSYEHGEIGPGGSGWLATASIQDTDVDPGSPCLAGFKGAPTKLLAGWVAILALGMMFGCTFRVANETNALSNLKKYQVATSLYQVEEGYGKYGTMSELYEANQGIIDQALYDAWDGNPDPRPLSGYLFSEIVQDTDGEPLDFRERAGLCAYPVGPGKIGDDILCVLSDFRKFNPEPIPEEGFVSHGEEWTFYRARYRDIGEPLRRFPSDSELQRKFVPFSKRIFE